MNDWHFSSFHSMNKPWLVIILLMLPIMHCDNALWVWAPTRRQAEKFRDSSRVIGLFSELSYIEISRENSAISVDLVQKGDDWIGQFCTPVLPAAMSNFIDLYSIKLEDIKYLKVTNLADPWIAGCKCYLRLFVSMGFTFINGESVESESAISEYCLANTENPKTLAQKSRRIPLSKPPVSLAGAKAIKDSYTFTQVYAFDGESVALFSDISNE
jgi:hypothetical protein